MKYTKIRSMDISNGEGIGVSLFVQGCHFHCKGCFNKETWDFNGGEQWTKAVEDNFLSLVDKPYIKRVSILGGEPLATQNCEEVFQLCKKIKNMFPDKDIWVYSGYTFEQIQQLGIDIHILKYIDVLVDGPYIEEQRDISLPFRGSRNQRLINTSETLKQNKIITIQND